MLQASTLCLTTYAVLLAGTAWAGGQLPADIKQHGPLQLQGVQSHFKCTQPPQWAHPGRTVCEINNLIIYNGELRFLGNNTLMPLVLADWYTEQQHWIGSLEHAGQLDFMVPDLPVTVLRHKRAVVELWLWWSNYFHAVTEYLPTTHSILCSLWGDCAYAPVSDLQLILVNTDLFLDEERQQAEHEPMRCIAGGNNVLTVDSPGNTTANEVVLVERALVGWGPACRSDRLHCKPWGQSYSDDRLPPAMMQLWQQRLADCTFNAFVPGRDVRRLPMRITVINRARSTGRSIDNIDQLIRALRARYGEATVRLCYLEGMDMAEQAEVFNTAQVLIWMHGASMGNFIFLPENATAVQIVHRSHLEENYIWPEAWADAVPNRVNLFHVNVSDPAKLTFADLAKCTLDPIWPSLTEADRRLVMIAKVLPPGIHSVLPNPADVKWREEHWFKNNLFVTVDPELLFPYIDPVVLHHARISTGSGRLHVPRHSRRKRQQQHQLHKHASAAS